MKKVVVLLTLAVFLSGCVVRTYTVEKNREDTQIKGNRGYLVGEPDEDSPKIEGKRKISIVEIEWGPKSDREVSASSGQEQETVVEEDIEVDEYQDTSDNEDWTYVEEDLEYQDQQEESAPVEFQDYVVQKNDTLQKISQKFYGTTRKWLMIFDYNKEALKSPNKIYPGQTLKIPVLEELK